ncbi:MAG: tRNA pseudouridine(55) synthase TruB [Flavobacteriales bacterium]|nr:tRNA pseudouridine(55) synthase TruB [Flavobacteriales bacterium]
MNKESLIEGLIIPIFKPLNWTSFDVVKKLRGNFKKTFNLKKIKVGHAGTLDPLATGLLLICTGRKTKIIEDLQNLDKTYLATFDFGKTTPSFDRETDFNKNYPTDHITEELVVKNLKYFQGKIKQKPPIYSALKFNGKRMYEIARKGKTIDIEYREVFVHEFDMLNSNFPEFDFRIKCSKGTYIRSLANDFGKKLKSGAYLKYLERYSIGEYSINKSLTIESVSKLISNQ